MVSGLGILRGVTHHIDKISVASVRQPDRQNDKASIYNWQGKISKKNPSFWGSEVKEENDPTCSQ